MWTSQHPLFAHMFWKYHSRLVFTCVFHSPHSVDSISKTFQFIFCFSVALRFVKIWFEKFVIKSLDFDWIHFDLLSFVKRFATLYFLVCLESLDSSMIPRSHLTLSSMISFVMNLICFCSFCPALSNRIWFVSDNVELVSHDREKYIFSLFVD